MQELIENISESEKQLLEYASGQDPYKVRGAAPIGEVSLLAPIPHPRQDVICLGINYMAHAEESARFKKEAFDGERPHAIYFSKRVNRATDPGAGIPSHRDIVTDLDYEAERQDSNTELLIFDISHIVSELSQGMTLKPGTIIATGTPAGVGMGFNPPKFLVPGDVVECTIEGIGTIANKVTD